MFALFQTIGSFSSLPGKTYSTSWISGMLESSHRFLKSSLEYHHVLVLWMRSGSSALLTPRLEELSFKLQMEDRWECLDVSWIDLHHARGGMCS